MLEKDKGLDIVEDIEIEESVEDIIEMEGKLLNEEDVETEIEIEKESSKERKEKESRKERKERKKREKEIEKEKKIEEKERLKKDKELAKEIEKQRKINEYLEYKKKKELKKKSRKPKDIVKLAIRSISIMFLLVILWVVYSGVEQEVTGTMGYLKFTEDVSLNKIEKVQLTSEKPKFFTAVYKEGLGLEEQYDEEGNPIEYEIVDNKRIEKVIHPQTEDFIVQLVNNGVEIEYIEATPAIMVLSLLISLIPSMILIGLLVFYMVKLFGNQLGNGGGDGEVVVKDKPVLFEDVAGMTEEKEELMFALRSLTDDTLREKGIKPIKGILLEGPPGVGKTLLAKAVASEAGVNFLSYSGSDFVEVFVGMGASRIRSMYKRAEELAPCVVFIDEIDALGRKRSTSGYGGNQEADQTLIALLEKMDGMNTDKRILFIGATNRSDMLDSALVRPGRFDKIIHIGPPKSKEDREAIVKVHLRGKTLAEGLTVEQIAKHCYGLTGAEIASILNDSVIESIKAGREGIISIEDVDRATMKLMSKGLAKGRHLAADLERVAVHELGHALVNKAVGRKVVKVSVQPYSSGVGGVTVIDGESEGVSGLRKSSDLRNDIKVLYAGKVAEEIMLGECSVGASNDLERATLLLREYVGAYGMKEGSILSLVGLAKENLMITANEKLLQDMEEVGQEIYQEVVELLSSEEYMNYILQLTEKLMLDEVIYNFDEEVDKIKANS